MAKRVQNESKAGAFFLATLVLWLVSLCFEIVFNKRKELLCVIAGCCFFQTANWVIRFCLSRDPLFVNTSVSLLHSFITSASGLSPISFPFCAISRFFFWVFFLISIGYCVVSFSANDELLLLQISCSWCLCVPRNVFLSFVCSWYVLWSV